MKKLHTCAFLATAAALASVTFIGTSDAQAAAQVTYKDYSTLNSRTLNNSYSYTKVYWKENTTITVMQAAGKYPDADKTYDQLSAVKVGDRFTVSSKTATLSYITAGETLDLLVENSTATDSKGNDVDVLVRVSNVVQWESGSDEETHIPKSYAFLILKKDISGSTATTHPDEDSTTVNAINVGDPIIFWPHATRSDSISTIKFCKKGTYNTSTHDCTASDNTNLSAVFWDFDVPNSSWDSAAGEYTKYNDKPYYGNEGVIPQSGKVNFYYDTHSLDSGVELLIAQNGFGVKSINNANFNGIYYANSVFATVENMSNATWSFRYTGVGCGVGYIIGSAVPYEMPKPVKTVDKEKAKKGETVTYTIKQEVPNNYSTEADIVTWSSLWSNYSSIPRTKLYTGFTISDTFDSNLVLPAKSAITIKNESGKNVTNEFNISISGNKLSITSKDTSTLALYGHIYTVTVPTTVVETVNTSPISNRAQTVYIPTDEDPITLTSDPVNVGIRHTLTVIYIDDETEEEIADGYSEDYDHGASYYTNESDDIPDKYVLVETPYNADGTMNSDVRVIYRYLRPRTITVCWLDEETGEELAECTKEEYAVGDEYDTDPLDETPNPYQLVGEPDNAEGIVEDDVIVRYYYRKVKAPKTVDDVTKSIATMLGASALSTGLFVIIRRRR